jgi:hypothetical protein
LSDLGISRTQAGIGDPVTVSVTTTNIGDLQGTFDLELFVNNQLAQTKTITLLEKESSTQYFEVGQSLEGEYVVKLGDLSPVSFRVTSDADPVKPAEFRMSSLVVSPSSALVDEVVQISVRVSNVGEESGTYNTRLYIDDVLSQTKSVNLPGGATTTVVFETTQTNPGTYNVAIEELSDTFTIEASVEASENIKLTRLFVNPYEVWESETVIVRATVNNTENQEGVLSARLLVAGEAISTKQFIIEAGSSDTTIEFQITAGSGPSEWNSTKGYPVELINLGNQSNRLNGYFVVAYDGYHTLSINRSGGGSTPMIFTLDGEVKESPYFAILPADVEYSISTDEIVDLGTGIVQFSHWNDGVESVSRTFILDKKITLLANYIVISGYASCPSLYISNGTNYSYVTEVSNAGWLGYIDYIDPEGNIVFGGGNPWDHVKLDNDLFQPISDYLNEEYYDAVLFQQWDEIFYLDTAYLVVVDHPNNTEVYSTMVNYINPGFFGEIYTIDESNLLSPISAINEKGEDVLSQIHELDGKFTSTSNGVLSPSWDNITQNQLTLDLGDLSKAPEIKLVINGMVDWGPPEPYYDWIDQFIQSAEEGLVTKNTQINPPSYMEVLNPDGNWTKVPQNRQIPIPGDYVPRTFAVDLNGLFPDDATEYKIRITNFWNVTFDYIGIDISTQKEISVYEIFPNASFEPIGFASTTTNASGNFTKYGDVSELLSEADDKYVIGIQGDKISLKFPTSDIPDLQNGMKRSTFLFVACWFKDTPDNWGYGFEFTVDPLPFRGMSGFPYPSTESYPSTEEYIQYLSEWNTRTINLQ